MNLYSPFENLTLSESQLKGVVGTGKRLRAFCCIHGSDKQRSLCIDCESGRFYCFACGAWGYMDWARERWKERDRHGRRTQRTRAASTFKVARPAGNSRTNTTTRQETYDLDPYLSSYQKALPGGLGEEYLRRRGIPLKLAQACGLGYSPPGQWAHRSRDWKWGRLVFPHTDPNGQIVNLYGRAIGADNKIPKHCRHDHLPLPKGYFNASVIANGTGPLVVCEGPFDALSLMAAGWSGTVAIFGLNGWRWDWVRDVKEVVLALDADAGGQGATQKFARGLALRGKLVGLLTAEDYGGKKDANAAWVTGSLALEKSLTPALRDPGTHGHTKAAVLGESA